MWSDSELADLIGPGRVHRAVYTDPTLFELELRRIFGRAWLYVGHESQVRAPGDFIVTRHGSDRIILVRHTDGALHALYNRCTHRGAEVCSQASGQTRSFTCPYHAWSFGTDGRLEAIPHGAPGYGERLPGMMRDLGLLRVPRVAAYQGFIFASGADDGIGLEEFLGPEVCAVFDNFVDRAPDGELELMGGKIVQVFAANWKMQIENSIDLLHPSILHRNAIDAANAHVMEDGIDVGARIAIELNGQNWHPFRAWDEMGVYPLARGHCFMGTFFKKADKAASQAGRFGSDDAFRYEAQARYKAALVARRGPEKAEAILGFSRHNTVVYPNLFVNPRIQQIRILHPTAVDRTEQHCWAVRLKGAPDETNRIAVRILTASNSPAALATADDHEVFEQMQTSLGRGSSPWLDLGRNIDGGGIGDKAPGTSEAPMRNQHAAWLGYMTGALQ